jgi:hypothetical protein
MTGPYHPTGRARVSARRPEAHGICDDCGFRYLRRQLRPKQQWTGMKLQTFNILVCNQCWDIPQTQLRTLIIPPDPIPIRNPRPEQFSAEVPSYASTLTGNHMTTTSGVKITMMIRVTPVSTPPPQSGYLAP